jgi:hypothetical protein
MLFRDVAFLSVRTGVLEFTHGLGSLVGAHCSTKGSTKEPFLFYQNQLQEKLRNTVFF